MLKFTAVNANNVKDLLPYFLLKKVRFSDYSLGISYIWRNVYNIQYCISDETLVMKIDYGDHNTCFYYPIGKNIEITFLKIKEYALFNHKGLEFCALTENELVDIKRRFPYYEVITNRNWSDYLYDIDDHATFKGKHLANKRSLYNKFVKENPGFKFVVEQGNEQERINQFYEEYIDSLEHPSKHQLDEIKNTRDLTELRKELDLTTAYIEINHKIVGLTMGEVVNDTLIIHIEKALPGYNGIYQVLVKEFASFFVGKVKYINREEDDGVAGLRESKLQYRPVELLNKNFFVVKNNLTLLNALPTLSSTRVILSSLDKRYEQEYCDLVMDELNNQFWGYDYKSDLNGIMPSPHYFANEVKIDFENKACFSYIISNRNTHEFIGEIVFHMLTNANTCEIGIRLVKNMQHHGYARESLGLAVDFLLNTIQLNAISSNCYKQNKASRDLFLSLGFIETDYSNTHYFFERTK